VTPRSVRAVIVDDEPPARSRLKRLLSEHSDVEVVGEAGDGLSALATIESLHPDVVFLDVQMPELDGLGVAAALGENGPAVVFATAYDAHAIEAFKLAAVDYLLKPIDRIRLAASLSRVSKRRVPAEELARAVLERLEPRRSRKMAVRCGAKYVVFDVAGVAAVLAQDHYAAILVDSKELLSEESLDHIMMRLDPEVFLRVHRSAIVNMTLVKELEQEGERKYVTVLADARGTRVPIARDRLEAVKAHIGI
jgi:two-component system LytT family response regulator